MVNKQNKVFIDRFFMRYTKKKSIFTSEILVNSISRTALHNCTISYSHIIHRKTLNIDAKVL